MHVYMLHICIYMHLLYTYPKFRWHIEVHLRRGDVKLWVIGIQEGWVCVVSVLDLGVWKHVSLYTLKPRSYTCIHNIIIILHIIMHVHTYVCHLHVLKLVASEGTIQLATIRDTRLQLFREYCRPYQCSVAHKHHRNLQIDNNNSQSWNNYNGFIYVGDNNDCYTIAQWSYNQLVSLFTWYVPLTIRLSSTHSPQYVFESWVQYCKSYNHICIYGNAQFERMWLQEEM